MVSPPADGAVHHQEGPVAQAGGVDGGVVVHQGVLVQAGPGAAAVARLAGIDVELGAVAEESLQVLLVVKVDNGRLDVAIVPRAGLDLLDELQVFVRQPDYVGVVLVLVVRLVVVDGEQPAGLHGVRDDTVP